MKPDEAAFEEYVATWLTERGGYDHLKGPGTGKPPAFDPTNGIDTEDLFEFIGATQAEAWERLKQLHGGLPGAQTKFVARLAAEIDRRGTLDVLRHGVIDHGVTVRLAYFRPAHRLTPELVRLYAANRLNVTRQLVYQVGSAKTIDLGLFVNGLLVATAELKNALTGQTAEDAIAQYRAGRDPASPALSRRALVHFAVDTERVAMTTRLAGEATRFLRFNLGEAGGAGNPANPNGHRTAYLWERIWQRDAWLDLLARFVHVEQPPKGSKAAPRVVFPRFHQWDAVLALEAHARTHGPGEKYLVQHSAGSGKSNTIAWLAHRLSSLHDAADTKVFDKVIVITDRVVLDRQLQETIYQFEHAHGVVAKIDELYPAGRSARRTTVADRDHHAPELPVRAREDFRTHVAHKIGGRAKAMVVTASRLHAVRHKRALDKYLATHGYGDVTVFVAFSGPVSDDGVDVTEAKMNGFPDSQTARRFDEEGHLLVVAEKYQTGFDQPLLYAMYVDKALTGLAAMQTLSRLNRTTDGKDGTFVLDFRNDAEAIRGAFEPWYGRTVAPPTDPNLLYDTRAALDPFGVLFAHEVERVTGLLLTMTSAKDHARIHAALQPAIDRFRALDEDDQDGFREALDRFVRTYSFLAQLVSFGDIKLERDYTFCRALAAFIRRDPGSTRSRPTRARRTASPRSRVAGTHHSLGATGRCSPTRGAPTIRGERIRARHHGRSARERREPSPSPRPSTTRSGDSVRRSFWDTLASSCGSHVVVVAMCSASLPHE